MAEETKRGAGKAGAPESEHDATIGQKRGGKGASAASKGKGTARAESTKEEKISVVKYLARKGVPTADWKFYERLAELAGVTKAASAEWRRILGI